MARSFLNECFVNYFVVQCDNNVNSFILNVKNISVNDLILKLQAADQSHAFSCKSEKMSTKRTCVLEAYQATENNVLRLIG